MYGGKNLCRFCVLSQRIQPRGRHVSMRPEAQNEGGNSVFRSLSLLGIIGSCCDQEFREVVCHPPPQRVHAVV